MISRRDYGKVEGNCIHAGCLEIYVSSGNEKLETTGQSQRGFKGVEIANSFRKLFGFDSIKAHPTIERHSVPVRSRFVPLEMAESAPAPNNGEMRIMPFPPCIL